jgi:hypothetical protein
MTAAERLAAALAAAKTAAEEYQRDGIAQGHGAIGQRNRALVTDRIAEAQSILAENQADGS